MAVVLLMAGHGELEIGIELLETEQNLLFALS